MDGLGPGALPLPGHQFLSGQFYSQSKEPEGGGGSTAIPLCSGPRPEGGDRGVQILQAGKMWGTEKRGRRSQARQGVLSE